MALLNTEEIAPEGETTRENIIARAIVDSAPSVPGFTCVRGVSPLVMLALQLANNPFVTNRPGFVAAGVRFDTDGKQVSTDAEFGILMMPKTAEMLVLLTCDREQLKKYSASAETLQSAALDFMESSTMEELSTAAMVLGDWLSNVAKTRAVKAPDEDRQKPADMGEATGPKKPARTGSRKY